MKASTPPADAGGPHVGPAPSATRRATGGRAVSLAPSPAGCRPVLLDDRGAAMDATRSAGRRCRTRRANPYSGMFGRSPEVTAASRERAATMLRAASERAEGVTGKIWNGKDGLRLLRRGRRQGDGGLFLRALSSADGRRAENGAGFRRQPRAGVLGLAVGVLNAKDFTFNPTQAGFISRSRGRLWVTTVKPWASAMAAIMASSGPIC